MRWIQGPVVLSAALLCWAGAAHAQSPLSGYQSPAEQEVFGTDPGKAKGGALGATNPFDLINRLRKATALDDATDPSDAIDAALKGWDAQTMNSAP